MPDQLQAEPAAISTPQPATEMPGVIALIRSGIAMYKERVRTVLSIAVLQLVMTLIFVGVIAAGVATAIVLGATLSSAVVITVLGVSIIALGIFFFWVTTAMMQVFINPAGTLGFGAAFGRARPQVLPLVWVAILSLLMTIAGPILLAGAGFGLSFVLPVSTIIVVLLSAAALVYMVVVWVKYMLFAYWAVVADNERGINALKKNSRIMKGRYGAVIWRFVGIGLITMLANILVSIIAALLGIVITKVGAQFITQAFSIFVVTPIVVGASLTLYRAVKAAAGEA